MEKIMSLALFVCMICFENVKIVTTIDPVSPTVIHYKPKRYNWTPLEVQYMK